MKFYDGYDNQPPAKNTPSGTSELDIYQEDIDKKGKRILVKCGSTNLYEKIQAQMDDCDIYKIVEKYQKTHNPEILNQRQAIYGDFTNMPNSAIDAINMARKAEMKFDTLDKEVREAFENDVNVFKASLGNGEFNKIMNKFIEKEEVENITTQNTNQTQATQNNGMFNNGGNR